MEQRSEGLEDKVIEARRKWDRKRSDPSVPSAVPEDREAPPEKEEGESPAPEAPPENAETKTPPTEWEHIGLEQATEMIAERLIRTREET